MIMKRNLHICQGVVFFFLFIAVLSSLSTNCYADWGENAPLIRGQERVSGPAIMGTLSFRDDYTYTFSGMCQGSEFYLEGTHLFSPLDPRILESRKYLTREQLNFCIPAPEAYEPIPFWDDDGKIVYLYELIVKSVPSVSEVEDEAGHIVQVDFDIVLLFVIPKE